jgi:hypothetical protein
MKHQEETFDTPLQSHTDLQHFDIRIAQKIGLKEAIILHQIHERLTLNQSSKVKNGKHWITSTYEQWARKFPFWSKRTIQRAILNLEELGILEAHLSGGYRTIKYYTVNYEILRGLGIKCHKRAKEYS